MGYYSRRKTEFDRIYTTLDTQNRGHITGEQAVGFFSNSRLPEEALAQIWDLADINSEGHLNRDEFAVAMYLIRQQRSKRDGRDVLPQSLPPNLIPPSMRRQPIAPQQPTAPSSTTLQMLRRLNQHLKIYLGLTRSHHQYQPHLLPQYNQRLQVILPTPRHRLETKLRLHHNSFNSRLRTSSPSSRPRPSVRR